MSGRRLLVAMALALSALLAAPAGAREVAGQFRYAIDQEAKFPDVSRTANRNGIVILQSYQTRLMRRLKARNPRLRVLVYKNLAAMTYRAHDGLSTGVSTEEANRHRTWYLLNTSGDAFTFRSYSWLWAADIGDPTYQRRWADNVISVLRRQGWDGVLIDDANPTIKYHYDPHRVLKYPNDTLYGAAMRSALGYIGPRIRAAGKLAIANLGAWREYSGVVNKWLRYLDGGMDERFAKWGSRAGQGYIWDWGAEGWRTQLRNLEYTESLGKKYLAITHSGRKDRRAARYGWATVLLGARGRSYFALHPDYATETWFPEYGYRLGKPVGTKKRNASGVYRRRFVRGLVLVNPTASTRRVRFGGTYSGSGLSAATRATMAPHSGLVLKRRSG